MIFLKILTILIAFSFYLKRFNNQVAILGEPFGRAGNKVEWIEKFAF